MAAWFIVLLNVVPTAAVATLVGAGGRRGIDAGIVSQSPTPAKNNRKKAHAKTLRKQRRKEERLTQRRKVRKVRKLLMLCVLCVFA